MMRFRRHLTCDRERFAFAVTLMMAVGFVVLGMFTGTDEVYGAPSTSSTVTVTVNATLNSHITLVAYGDGVSQSLDMGSLVPGSDSALSAWGTVGVTSNSAQGYKIYNYMLNYMSRTADLDGNPVYIANTPSGTPSAPDYWTEDTDYGIGFSLSGPINDAQWHNGSGNFNYASFTTTSAAAQVVNNYTTWSNVAPEYLSVLYVLDAGSAQASGTYTGFVGWFAITNV